MQISRMFVSVGLVALLAGVSVPSFAATNGSIKVKSIAQIEKEVVGADGKKHITLVPADKAVPGTAVLFTNTFENIGSKEAGNIAINNPVPNNTEYQAGSAYGADSEITFSIDGGKTFAAPEKLKIKTEQGEQMAKPSAYTHIRWSYQKQLAPGATGEVGFRAVIK